MIFLLLILFALAPLVSFSSELPPPECHFEILAEGHVQGSSLQLARTVLPQQGNEFQGHTLVQYLGGGERAHEGFRSLDQFNRHLETIELGTLLHPILISRSDKNGREVPKEIILDRPVPSNPGAFERVHATQLRGVYRVLSSNMGETIALGKEELDAVLDSSVRKDVVVLHWDNDGWYALKDPRIPAETALFIAQTPHASYWNLNRTYPSLEQLGRAPRGSFKDPVVVYVLNAEGKLVPSSIVLDRKVTKQDGSEGKQIKRVDTNHLDAVFRVTFPDGSVRTFTSHEEFAQAAKEGAFEKGAALAYRLDKNGNWSGAFSVADIAVGTGQDAMESSSRPYWRTHGAPANSGARAASEEGWRKARQREFLRAGAGSMTLLGALAWALSQQTMPASDNEDPPAIELMASAAAAEGPDESDIVFSTGPISENKHTPEGLTREEILNQLAQQENSKAMTAPESVVQPVAEVGTIAATEVQAEPQPPATAHNLQSDAQAPGDPESRESVLAGGHGGGGKNQGPSFFGLSTLGHKRVVFVVDISSSMDDIPLDSRISARQLVAADLPRAIRSLADDCEMNILPFGDSCTPWRPQMVKVNSRVKDKAVQFAGQMGMAGGTNFDAALLAAAAQSPGLIFFLSDGNATISPDTMQYLKGITINAIAIGSAANTAVLEELAKTHGGKFIHIK